MIEACQKLKKPEEEPQASLLNFQKTLATKANTWHSKVRQVFQLTSIQYHKNPELEPFINESSLPLTQTILTHLSTFPPNPEDFDTLAYITRGSFELFTYNFSSNSFNSLKLPEKILKWSGVVQYSPFHLLITGGKPSKNQGSITSCFSLNLQTSHLEHFPSMPTSHSSHVSLHHKGQVYIISGKNDLNGISSCCERLDLASKTWYTLSNNVLGRTCAAGVVHKERIFIIGGCKNNSIEKYSLAKDQWKLLSYKLFDVLWQHLAISTGERVLVFGGDSVYDTPTRYSFLLDTKTGEVSQLNIIPVGQCWLCGWYPNILRGNRVWVMNKELKFLSYNLNTGQWSSFKNQLKKPK